MKSASLQIHPKIQIRISKILKVKGLSGKLSDERGRIAQKRRNL